MLDLTYPWKRFWIPQGTDPPLDFHGYLRDPEIESYWATTLPMQYEDIHPVSCLILLGEPGMGKSTTLATAVEHTKRREPESTVLCCDLGGYQTDDLLDKDIFHHPDLQAWLAGDHHLFLFLDSLDECLATIRTVSRLLRSRLDRLPIKRMSLRIACRTGDWSELLEKHLRHHWPDEKTAVLELTPLRRQDVSVAAAARGVEEGAFFDEVSRRDAQAFASRPITLQFLLHEFSKHGGFPRTQTELYLRGCELLCNEMNPNRVDSGLIGNLSSQERLVIAARIAAVSLLGNRSSIWTGKDLGNIPDGDIKVEAVVGRTESVNDLSVDVTETAIKEVLSTALFSSRGNNRLGWSHQTYAECLAAHYIALWEMSLPQVEALISHPFDGKVIPQLGQLAAWLSNMRPDVRREILRRDPEVLLRSDLTNMDPEDREALVSNLLELLDSGELIDLNWSIRDHFWKLDHRGLADQLKTHVVEPTENLYARRFAIDVAEACYTTALVEDLLSVTLDQTQPIGVRIPAAHAVVKIGDDAAKIKLKPLALGDAGPDPELELKGYGLQAVWPNHLSAEELFKLIEPRENDLLGSYWVFLMRHVTPGLTVADLPIALDWVKRYGSSTEHLPLELWDLIDELLMLALGSLDDSAVAQSLAETLWSGLRDHDLLGPSHGRSRWWRTLDTSSKRRGLLPKMVSTAPDDDWRIWVYTLSPLIRTIDTQWMIEQLLQGGSEREQAIWAHLINRSFDLRDPDQTNAVLVASQKSDVLAEIMGYWLKPIELGSADADKLRSDYERTIEITRGTEKPAELLDPPPHERISRYLEKIEAGQASWWWVLARDLELEPDSTIYRRDFDSDLKSFYGWESANPDTRARILSAAHSYLEKESPDVNEILGTNVWHHPSYAGYKALRLLLDVVPDKLDSLSDKAWERWSPVILIYLGQAQVEDDNAQKALSCIAKGRAPGRVIETLMNVIQVEDEGSGHVAHRIRWVDDCWDERLGDTLLTAATTIDLGAGTLADLLEVLLRHEVSGALEFALATLDSPSPADDESREKVITIASKLFQHGGQIGFMAFWQVANDDPDLGAEIISALADGIDELRNVNSLLQLPETQLADLYIWLQSNYPEHSDPGIGGNGRMMGAVTRRHRIADFRNHVLSILKHMGTFRACDEIRRIIDVYPESDRLRSALVDAQEIARQTTWLPPSPQEILSLVQYSQTRLIQNGNQLLEVVIGSLDELQSKLHGETPAIADLWNKLPNNKYRPKDEPGLSDYLKRHLEATLIQRGVVISREVEIRRGEETDIYLTAIIPGETATSANTIRAIVEVKCNWNDKIYHDMEDQLVNRYLRDNQCRHGLYVAGWFRSDKWDPGDSRSKKARKISVEQAQEKLNAQATDLSDASLMVRAYVLDTRLD